MLPNYEAGFPDPINDATVSMGEIHANIHKGWMWHVNFLQLALGAGADLDMLISVGTIPAHMRFILTVSQSVRAEAFEATDSAGGTPVTVHNRNRFFAASTPLATITTAPTVTSPGTSLGPTYVTGGGGPHAPGSSTAGFEEWLLLPSTLYLFRVSNNVVTGTTDVHIALDWYEPLSFETIG